MKKGEIWIIDIPPKGAHEQKGVRPGFIIATTGTNMIITIPLTSNLHSINFPNTLKIKNSETNNLKKDSIALIFQMLALDRRRFIQKVGDIEKEYLNQIDEIIKNMFF